MRSTLSCIFSFDRSYEVPGFVIGFRNVRLWFIGAGLAWRLWLLIVTGTALSL
jgi:hypothetical protein